MKKIETIIKTKNFLYGPPQATAIEKMFADLDIIVYNTEYLFNDWTKYIINENDLNLLFLSGKAEMLHILYEGATIIGDISFYHCRFDRLPENMIINGDLYFNHVPLKAMPENITINGRLYLLDTLIMPGYIMPKGVKVRDTIDIYRQ